MNPVPEPSLGRRLGEILGLAAAYAATGKLALLLAIPPGYATAIWPPSGIALTGLLLLGSRAWLGILLGSFLANVSGTSGPALAVAATIAAGASAQALLGAFLVRRFLGTPLELLRGRDIAMFLLLGGVASCAVSPTVGVLTLYARKLIQVREFPFNWWTWWVGDVIGVAVVAPLVLIAFGTPREVWRRRTVSVALPLGILLVLTSALFGFVRIWERSRIATELDLGMINVTQAIQVKADEIAEVLYSLEDFRVSSPRFDRETFRSFAEGALRRCPSLQALSWNPRTTDAERGAFESDGPCRITERDAKERLVPAPRRSEYVPVRYIEPQKGNEGIIGFDVSSSIARVGALNESRDSGRPRATGKLRLMQGGDESFGVLVLLPAYGKTLAPDASQEERRRNLVGYFAGVVRLNQFFGFLGIGKKAGIDFRIRTSDLEENPEELWRTPDPGTTSAAIRSVHTRVYWGHSWTVESSAAAEYVAAAQSWRPWGVLAGGLAAAGLVGAFLLAVSGRAVLISRSTLPPR